MKQPSTNELGKNADQDSRLNSSWVQRSLMIAVLMAASGCSDKEAHMTPSRAPTPQPQSPTVSSITPEKVETRPHTVEIYHLEGDSLIEPPKMSFATSESKLTDFAEYGWPLEFYQEMAEKVIEHAHLRLDAAYTDGQADAVNNASILFLYDIVSWFEKINNSSLNNDISACFSADKHLIAEKVIETLNKILIPTGYMVHYVDMSGDGQIELFLSKIATLKEGHFDDTTEHTVPIFILGKSLLPDTEFDRGNGSSPIGLHNIHSQRIVLYIPQNLDGLDAEALEELLATSKIQLPIKHEAIHDYLSKKYPNASGFKVGFEISIPISIRGEMNEINGVFDGIQLQEVCTHGYELCVLEGQEAVDRHVQNLANTGRKPYLLSDILISYLTLQYMPDCEEKRDIIRYLEAHDTIQPAMIQAYLEAHGTPELANKVGRLMFFMGDRLLMYADRGDFPQSSLE